MNMILPFWKMILHPQTKQVHKFFGELQVTSNDFKHPLFPNPVTEINSALRTVGVESKILQAHKGANGM